MFAVCVGVILLLAALGLLANGRGARDPLPQLLLALLLAVGIGIAILVMLALIRLLTCAILLWTIFTP